MARQTGIERQYRMAREQYAGLGVDTDRALKKLARLPISLHCWQNEAEGLICPLQAAEKDKLDREVWHNYG